ncbi:tetratricopeptide repeat protein, partial [bacterium]|nr:tetratricopeptide repeat protein [bacterium]
RSLPFWPLIAALPALFLWHYMSLILFPAIGLAGFIRSRKSHLSQKNFLLLLSGLFVFIFLFYWLTPLSRGIKWLLPLAGTYSHDGYTLFSAHHLFDFMYEMVLVVPLSLFFLVAAFAIQRNLLQDSGFQVLTFAAFFGLAAAFVFNPELGMPRDWDLLAALLLPLSLLSGYALAVANPTAATYRRAVGGALVSLLLIAVPLIWVNHSWDSSVARYKDLLMTHKERAAYGWEILGGFMWARGDDAGRLECWEKAAEVSSNQRYLQGVGMLAMQMGQYEKARRATAKLRKYNPRSFMEANDYFVLFVQLGFVEEAERMLPFLRELAPPGQDMSVYMTDLARAKGDSTYMTEPELPPKQNP